MAEASLSLYEVNKQVVSQNLKPLDDKTIKHELIGVGIWCSYVQDRYFMLLCHDRRDYTLFHFSNRSKQCYEFSTELQETLQNRGEILDISYEQKQEAYSIWLKIGKEVFLYHLFPYDVGVIEV